VYSECTVSVPVQLCDHTQRSGEELSSAEVMRMGALVVHGRSIPPCLQGTGHRLESTAGEHQFGIVRR
jgi:hypothetical protein